MDINFDSGLNEFDFKENDFKINIRIKQRNGKKHWTFIENLEEITDFDFTKTTKELKKKLCCNASIKLSKNDEKYIQLQGDQREPATNYLVETLDIDLDKIVIHGY